MLEELRVLRDPSEPAVPERDRGQVEAFRGGVHDTRLTGERQVAAQHRVRAAPGEFLSQFLGVRRHGLNVSGWRCPPGSVRTGRRAPMHVYGLTGVLFPGGGRPVPC